MRASPRVNRRARAVEGGGLARYPHTEHVGHRADTRPHSPALRSGRTDPTPWIEWSQHSHAFATSTRGDLWECARSVRECGRGNGPAERLTPRAMRTHRHEPFVLDMVTALQHRLRQIVETDPLWHATKASNARTCPSNSTSCAHADVPDAAQLRQPARSPGYPPTQPGPLQRSPNGVFFRPDLRFNAERSTCSTPPSRSSPCRPQATRRRREPSALAARRGTGHARWRSMSATPPRDGPALAIVTTHRATQRARSGPCPPLLSSALVPSVLLIANPTLTCFRNLDTKIRLDTLVVSNSTISNTVVSERSSVIRVKVSIK